MIFLWDSLSSARTGKATTQSTETYMAEGQWSVPRVPTFDDARHEAHGVCVDHGAATTSWGKEKERLGIYY